MLWDQTKQLPKEMLDQVKESYKDFPLEVRLHLATWIEEKFSPTQTFVMEDPNHQKTAISLANQLHSQLEAKIVDMPNDPDKFMVKQKLEEIAGNLKRDFASNPLGLFLTIRNCLEHEMRLVQMVPSSAGTDTGIADQIRQQITSLKQRVQETGLELDRCKQEQEAFSVEYYHLQEKNIQFQSFVQQNGEQHPDVKKYRATKEGMENATRQKYLSLVGKRSGLFNSYVEIYKSVRDVQAQVLDKELIRWKRDQQLAGNGHPINMSLEVLQEWCEGLADIIWTMRQQVRQLEGLREKLGDSPNTGNLLPDLLASITELLSNLVTGTFIIEKQPPQVMKTNTRFTATVRLLVGGVLNVHMAAPAVTVSIVSETQANALLTSPSNIPKKKDDYSSGDILNGNGTMEFHAATKQVSVAFRNLQLKKIKRTEKKGTESVMDEKFSVLFWTEFQVGELKFQLWTLSLPVVVIVHGNQEPQALATVTWDNAFAEWGRRPFVVPDTVSWRQAGAALNMKWKASCGSELTDDNLYFLACKAFRDNNLPRNPEEYNNRMLTWPQFCKETLPDRSFTFWEWFYRILILTSNHMQGLWKAGHVMGFVTKQAAEVLLLQKQSGCFLLRFSDSGLGGVTIAYVKNDIYQNRSEVLMVAPFTTKDLSQRSMADVIFDLSDLSILYPDTPKESFTKFSSKAQSQNAQSSNGYVPHKLVTHVDGISGTDSAPATPAAGYDIIGVGSHPGDAQSPVNFVGMDDMDVVDNIPNIDIGESIDVRAILGLDDNFLPPNQSGTF